MEPKIQHLKIQKNHSFKNDFCTILSTQNNKTFIANEDLVIHRYYKGFLLIITKKSSDDSSNFKRDIVRLYQETSFPLLSLNDTDRLFFAWKTSNSIINLLRYAINKLNNSNDFDSNFWGHLIKYLCVSKSETKTCFAKLNILVQLINKKIISSENWIAHSRLIYLIFDTCVTPSIKYKSNREIEKIISNSFSVLFFWFKQLKKKPSNIEVYAFVYEQFYPTITLNAGDIKKEIEFYQLLATKLPADFMLNCTRTDLTKWFEFYLLNPFFFEQLDANQKIENGFEFFISLFKNFKISGALLACFYAGENHRTELDFQEKQWFVSVLNGESIRKQSNLPCVISKKAAHVFLNLPANADLSIKQALIYSALIAKDVKADFAQIIAKRIYIYDNIDFWIETLSILFHKGLLKSTLFEVMDYINHQVIVNKRAINFKTKKINNLNFEVWEWHEQLRVEKDFKKIGFKKFTISQVDEFRFRKGESFYRIKQLKNTKELFLEAQKMQHCVLSYTNLCRRNICTIYSLTQSSENEDLNHLITIEVRNNTIVQMRGYKNRAVQSDEKEIIALWANENSLQIA